MPSWEKINVGMFRMYEGEVMKKFPVVQHFVFGALFRIRERDPSQLPAISLDDDAATTPPKTESAAAASPPHLETIQE